MKVIAQSYAMRLTRENVIDLRRDLFQLRGNLGGSYWDTIRKDYPSLYALFSALPEPENLEGE